MLLRSLIGEARRLPAGVMVPAVAEVGVPPVSEPLFPDDPRRDPPVAGPSHASAPQPTSDAGWWRTCTCGHAKQAHEHYRRGTDCALCDCRRYTNALRAKIPRRKG